MKLSDLSALFGFEAVFPAEGTTAIVDAYTSDLLSDVMAKAAEGSVLITIQAHKNTIAVASLIGIRAIVICNERAVPDDMVAAAKDEAIAIYRTTKTQFEVSGLLYRELRG
ncbi:MAG: iron-sulfur binding hydrogenase [Spirochaetes bacterium GWB1_59_5]|nr:MAG: iron-sulfur binding hydrogenase [Spirochaetes bacterium GWB1_59_5]